MPTTCWFCRRTQAEVEKEIQQKSIFISIDGEVYSDVQICEVCQDVLRSIIGQEIKDFISDQIKDIEEIIKHTLSKVLIQSGKIMTGQLKVEKRAEPIRVEKVAREEEEGEEGEEDNEEEEEGEEDENDDEEQ